MTSARSTTWSKATFRNTSIASTGMVTVLAARIGALSQKTTLYIGPKTMHLVKKDFKCVSIGTHTLKNVSGKTEVFQVKRLASENDKAD